MGWFWTEKSTTAAPHPLPRDLTQTPPAGCPMHKSANNNSPSPLLSASSATATSSEAMSGGGCPVKHDTRASMLASFAQGCPVPHEERASATPQSAASSSSSSQTFLGKLNPLNYMPSLPQTRAVGQTQALPTDREISSIPRGDTEANWEYPSPQQMYNAMARKDRERDRTQAEGASGSSIPVDAVESMVAIHNFLNEGAWAEIEGWEARFGRGLGFGWRTCRSGEEGFEREYRQAKREADWTDPPAPRLLRFMGRPGEPTPKARFFGALGSVAPSIASDPPFDRHDWYVQRRLPGGRSTEVRYVIDYYSGPPEPTGEPVFYLDVRPALDSPTAAVERMMRWGGDVWYRASGGSTRQ